MSRLDTAIQRGADDLVAAAVAEADAEAQARIAMGAEELLAEALQIADAQGSRSGRRL